MFRIVALSKRKEGLNAQAFRTHYETRHVPLVMELAPPPGEYRRSYIDYDDPLNTNANGAGFDVITEMSFADRAEFECWIATLTAPGAGERVQADQESFMDMAAFRVCAVQGE